MDRLLNKSKAICPSNFFKVGSIKIVINIIGVGGGGGECYIFCVGTSISFELLIFLNNTSGWEDFEFMRFFCTMPSEILQIHTHFCLLEVVEILSQKT